MSEELLGSDENYHSDVRPIDYERWPFYAALKAARQAGTLRLYWLGLGIDPLTLVADMLTVAVFDAPLFDRTFTRLVTANDEGHFLTDGRSDRSTIGFPFNSATVERFANIEPHAAGRGRPVANRLAESPRDPRHVIRSLPGRGAAYGAAGARLDPPAASCGSRPHESGSGWGTCRRGSVATRHSASGSRGKPVEKQGCRGASRRVRRPCSRPTQQPTPPGARRKRLGAPGCGSRWRLALGPATPRAVALDRSRQNAVSRVEHRLRHRLKGSSGTFSLRPGLSRTDRTWLTGPVGQNISTSSRAPASPALPPPASCLRPGGAAKVIPHL